MELSAVLRDIIVPTYTTSILPRTMDTPKSRVMLLACGGVETNFATRQQFENGPAHSFWQFERGGGVAGVLKHPATRNQAQHVCDMRGISATSQAVWEAMLTDDILGCAFARLLLYTDPMPLPAIGEQDAAWNYYLRNWRPGKPDEARWPPAYSKAVAAVRA